MSLFGFLLAQQQTAVPDQTGQAIKTVIMLAVFMVLMWVVMIAPQRKKAKEQEAMLGAMKNGDKIVTSSGIVGVVLSIKDKTVSIRSAESKLEVLKSAVTEVTERAGEASEAKSLNT
jgi:preprotein translocase subunit YajC